MSAAAAKQGIKVRPKKAAAVDEMDARQVEEGLKLRDAATPVLQQAVVTAVANFAASSKGELKSLACSRLIQLLGAVAAAWKRHAAAARVVEEAGDAATAEHRAAVEANPAPEKLGVYSGELGQFLGALRRRLGTVKGMESSTMHSAYCQQLLELTLMAHRVAAFECSTEELATAEAGMEDWIEDLLRAAGVVDALVGRPATPGKNLLLLGSNPRASTADA